MADAARHLQVLKERHRTIDAEIDDIQHRRTVDPARLSWMKRQRLALRDAIERLAGSRHAEA